ncbi:aminotransferase class I/II-fold pyridoxal phosphate-dependent enzyme [Burkholderiaceae bacterium UC74_6]
MSFSAHGGPDSGPTIRFDFSTNANPYGPPPALWRAVQQADRRRYPDPSYQGLREQLAAAHGVQPRRIEPAAGGAEAIRRLTLAAHLHGLWQAWVPQPGFGDYAAAAAALGLELRSYDDIPEPDSPALVWVCDPCNPTGASLDEAQWRRVAQAVERSNSVLAIDQAYDALRLDGRAQLPEWLATQAWRLQCPNKALGLTGVRAAYLIAPTESRMDLTVSNLAASWVLSAEGVELLAHWHEPSTLAHLDASREYLRQDRHAMQDALHAIGWEQRDTATPFWLARAPHALDLRALREQSIKLRDAASFGLPGWVRVSAQREDALRALLVALKSQQGVQA